ncbi:ParB N-terminal domain-containing protein [Kitasatospora sp. RB6PN24]|uniref:ParB/RepB/Spo0J family partition protein n=1 Tax=Kitasatospora humi TaxID=2893891 RepID=UPI001E4E2BB2|nr:ParB N-terminal domain-containing protein [Kitasatospora humi]MCC9309974.1 ParB N-terminal domain-containing protein [Kitasatospora humi]
MAVGAAGPTMNLGAGRRSIWDDPEGEDENVDAEGSEGSGHTEIPLHRLWANPFNPRTTRDEEEFDALVQSIKVDGQLQELVVCPVGGFLDYWRPRVANQPETAEKVEKMLGHAPEDEWVILIGHTRRDALEQVDVDAARCRISEESIPRARIIGLPENLRRIALNPIDEAIGFAGAMADGLTQVEVAQQTGCKQPYVSKRLKLLKLAPAVRKAVLERRLRTTHAELIADELPNADDLQIAAAKLIMDGNGKVSPQVAIERARRVPAARAEGAKANSKPAPQSPVPAPRPTGEQARDDRASSSDSADAPTATGAAGDDSTGADAQQPFETAAADQQGTEEPDVWIEDDFDDDLAEEQAADDTRAGACKLVATVFDMRNPRDAVKIMAPGLLLRSDAAQELALSWLTDASVLAGTPEELGSVLSRADSKLTPHIAFAVALAALELRAQESDRPWDDLDRQYLTYLQETAGYQLSDEEQQRLGA